MLARRGDHDAAAKAIQAAVATVKATEYVPLREFAALALAEVERLAGRAEGERAALEEALRLAEQKGNVVTAGRVRDRLVALAPVG